MINDKRLIDNLINFKNSIDNSYDMRYTENITYDKYGNISKLTAGDKALTRSYDVNGNVTHASIKQFNCLARLPIGIKLNNDNLQTKF